MVLVHVQFAQVQHRHSRVDRLVRQQGTFALLDCGLEWSNREGLFLLAKSYITRKRGQVTGEGEGGSRAPCIRAPAANLWDNRGETVPGAARTGGQGTLTMVVVVAQTL